MKEKLRQFFAVKEDRTEINSLLRIILDNKTTIESIELKKQLDDEFKAVLLERESNNNRDNEAIKNYLQPVNLNILSIYVHLLFRDSNPFRAPYTN